MGKVAWFMGEMRLEFLNLDLVFTAYCTLHTVPGIPLHEGHFSNLTALA